MAILLKPGESSELIENNVITQLRTTLDTVIYVNTAEKIRIVNSTGFVGIATIAPEDLFHVMGGTNTTGIFEYVTGTNNAVMRSLRLRARTTNGGGIIDGFGSGLAFSIMSAATVDKFVGRLDFVATAGSSTTSLCNLYTYLSASPVLCLQADQNGNITCPTGYVKASQDAANLPSFILENQLPTLQNIYMLVGTANILSTPVDAPALSLYFKKDTTKIYVKQDAGSTTNWLPIGSGAGAGGSEIEAMLSENNMEEIIFTSFVPFDPTGNPNIINETRSVNSTANIATSKRDFTGHGEHGNLNMSALPQNEFASNNPWTETKTGGATGVTAGGVLTLTVGVNTDIIHYNKNLAMAIEEVSDIDLEFRMKITAFSAGSDDAGVRIARNKLFWLLFRDNAGTKQIIVSNSGGSPINDIDGNSAVYNVNWDQWHVYKMQKIGQDRVQVFVDENLIFTVPYANLSTVGGVVMDIDFGHYATGSTSTSIWDYLNYRAYMSIMETKDITRRATIANEGSVELSAANEVLQESTYYLDDLYVAWTKGGLNTATPYNISSPEAYTRYTSAGGTPVINYSYPDSRLTSSGDYDYQARIRLISMVTTDVSIMQMHGNRRYVWINTKRVGSAYTLRMTAEGSTIPGGSTEVPIDLNTWYTLTLRRNKLNSFEFYLDGVLIETADYDVFPRASSTGPFVVFGSASNVDRVVDVQYIRTLADGDGPSLPKSPTTEVICFADHNDADPSYVVSTDGGRHWTSAIDFNSDGFGNLTVGLGSRNLSGGDLIVRYRHINEFVSTSSLTQFAVLYNVITNVDEEPMGGRYVFGPVVLGDLAADGTLTLNHNLNAAVNGIELEVFAGAARIHRDADYIEVGPNTVKINVGAIGAMYYCYLKPAGNIAREVGTDGRTVITIGDGINSVGDFIGSTQQVFIDAIAAAILSSGTLERKIFVGAGVYSFTVGVSVAANGVGIEGAGYNSQIVGPGTGSGVDAFTLSNTGQSIKGLKITNFRTGIQMNAGAIGCDIDIESHANAEGIKLAAGANENRVKGYIHDNTTNGIVDAGSDNLITALVIRNP